MKGWALVVLCGLVAWGRVYSVSGFSSGGFFAHQMHVIFSSYIEGAGIVAGGPYFCTMGSYNRFQTACKSNTYLISLTTSISAATQQAASNNIDLPGNLSSSKVYIFSGSKDTVVFPGVVQKTLEFYQNFIQPSNIVANFKIDAQHSWVTNGTGNPCWYLGPPGVNDCGFDLSGAILQQIYGALQPKGVQVKENLYSFDQTLYGNCWQAGLSSRGFVYVPERCMNSECSVHVLFHGCFGDFAINGFSFINEIGINDWAESNNLLIIFPQVIATSQNPEGCWDFWGYTSPSFNSNSSPQPSIIHKMAQNPPIVSW